MPERVEVLLSEEEVDRRIKQIGEQISRDYAGRQVHRYPWILCRYPVTAGTPGPAV